ncbi:histidine kinase dimerization/phosphoacceptor domain -containing protein [Salinisphaera sp. T31B1]|uniref:sensor histidine kinase n=1 Tax=Salinisphaera sp. T31B1 TaxID=727963 RepID=UPI00333FC057
MTQQGLEYRLRQQSLVSELGLYALNNRDFADLAQQATRIAAEGVCSGMAKVLRYRPDKHDFLVFAGVGWRQGVVGHATVGAALDSPAGYALQTGEPVISNHLDDETRFRTPDLLAEHGVTRAINVVIQATGEPFGVLEADAPSDGTFDKDDVDFLQSLAHVLASGIERGRVEVELETALQEKDQLIGEKETLLDELNHRVKNNLQVVSNLLAMEISRLDDVEAKARFRSVGNRVATLGRIYNHLYQAGEARDIEFGGYLRELCANLDIFYRNDDQPVRVYAEVEPVFVDLDRAIPLALMINELIANSARHAFPAHRQGKVQVTLASAGDDIVVTVADRGQGIGHDTAPGVGRELVDTLAEQLGARIEVRETAGTTFVIRISEQALQAEARKTA